MFRRLYERRIVRRAVMVLGIALLPVWYMASVATILFVAEAGWMPQSCMRPARAYIYPGVEYVNRNLPGASYCAPVLSWAMDSGFELRVRREREQQRNAPSASGSLTGSTPLLGQYRRVYRDAQPTGRC
jgi:hypothetical protein